MIVLPTQILVAGGDAGPVASISGLRAQNITHSGLFYYYGENRCLLSKGICCNPKAGRCWKEKKLQFCPHIELNTNLGNQRILKSNSYHRF
jgi:hypothetical protein